MAKKKYIESPEKLWELFRAYVKEVKSKPILQHDFIGGKELHEIRREKERPLTMDSFETYVMNLEGVKSKGIDQYFANQDGLYGEYMGICSRIRKEIKADQIEGGMAGIYNPSITQRLNGLTDKTESNVNLKDELSGVDYSKLSEATLKEIANATKSD